MSTDEPPLPFGWIKEHDPRTDHPFYVDTKANPPRAIWVHPYEDEQYLNEHPDIREKVGSMMKQYHANRTRSDLQNTNPPMPERRHSFSGRESGAMHEAASPSSPSSSKDKGKRSFFAKMKDKAIGTKEEREAYKRELERVENERKKARLAAYQAQQARYQQRAQQQQQYYAQAGPSQGYYPQQGYAGYGSNYPSTRYGPPAGTPYGNGYGRGGSSFGGSALPILGGLAGGLLLGDLLF